jgi:membrane-associated HD superfamily phosphohydrolase
MQILSLVWGILAFVGFFIALLPCLGSINWINIPFAFIGLIISIIAMVTTKEDKKTFSIVGIVLCGIAIVIGLIRLLIGGGVA